MNPANIQWLYASFDAPITAQDCGQFCAPNNDGVPFCCDTRYAVPTVYAAEWEYLQAHTDLWHAWQDTDPAETARLQAETAPGLVLVECQGHTRCQRAYRSLTCRATPFYPYVNQAGELIGLSYYRQYESFCWVVNHLAAVTAEYRAQFLAAFDALFTLLPGERENYRYHAAVTRRVFGRLKRTIPLLHRDGRVYEITPRDGSLLKAHLWYPPPL